MYAILKNNIYFLISIAWFNMQNQSIAQHYLATDLIQKAEDVVEFYFEGFNLIFEFSEDFNLKASATQFTWEAYDSTTNISFSYLYLGKGFNDVSSNLFHTPFLEDKTSIIYHSIISKEVLKNSFIGILNDETYRVKGYTELVFLDDDWLIYTFTNYIVKNTHLIVSTTFVVPENTPMEEILEIAHMIDSHIQIKVL